MPLSDKRIKKIAIRRKNNPDYSIRGEGLFARISSPTIYAKTDSGAIIAFKLLPRREAIRISALPARSRRILVYEVRENLLNGEPITRVEYTGRDISLNSRVKLISAKGSVEATVYKIEAAGPSTDAEAGGKHPKPKGGH